MKIIEFIKSLFPSDSAKQVAHWGRANIYKDSALRWRWRLLNTSGEIVASSCQSFANKDASAVAYNHARHTMFGTKEAPVKSVGNK